MRDLLRHALGVAAMLSVAAVGCNQDDGAGPPDARIAMCGDGTCLPSEIGSCAQDCGNSGSTCDNDNVCDPGETTACADCLTSVCDNDRSCENGENPVNCPNDCGGAACNNNGTCDAGETASSCPPDCSSGGTCNMDGMCQAGEDMTTCIDCLTNPFCNMNGMCEFQEIIVGNCADCTMGVCDMDGMCEAGEQGGIPPCLDCLTPPI